MKTDSLVHRLGPEVHIQDLPDRFTYPFRYTPAPSVREAAAMVIRHISETEGLDGIFSEGKMLGVLVVLDSCGEAGFLAGFSGLAGGRSTIPYFVPPILDLTDPHGHFKAEEEAISLLNEEIRQEECSPQLKAAEARMESVRRQNEQEISAWKSRMAASKARRAAARESGPSADILHAMEKESQYEKAQLRRITAECGIRLKEAGEEYSRLESRIKALKQLRQQKSEALQLWISGNMTVENALGERKSVLQIFSDRGLTPPGGTGECAAPKLLHYAYRHGLEPVAMGEFWYGGAESREKAGKSGEVRTHGRFYPSCTGKCGPLLGFMLQGLDVEDNPLDTAAPEAGCQESGRTGLPEAGILYEDSDIIVMEKPSGMLSVPGKTGGMSLQEIIEEEKGSRVYAVHRLDMDTSGIIVYAKNPEAHREMQRQFEKGEVRKEYIAIIDTGKPSCGTPGHGKGLEAGSKGTISLPIAPDYHDRPRRKVDFTHGKEAVTQYSITASGDGWAEVLFRPLTGRTHQLRVHAAHPLGLGAPIKGDCLYGSAHTADRLCLHASRIKFRHPVTGCPIELTSSPAF